MGVFLKVMMFEDCARSVKKCLVKSGWRVRNDGECLKWMVERRGGKVCRIARREENVPKKVG